MPLTLDAQEDVWSPPFDFPIQLSGNFGELRANHFHGGLDFKTGGATGKQVRALADGYISRIRVNHGSGYVLDVVYDKGYTAINRHLEAFVGDIAARVEALQYERASWEVEIECAPHEYPVKAGQVIALSGNTGYSFGPHLHLDMIETATGEYVDALPFFASRVQDHVAPRAEGILLFPRAGKGVVDGAQLPKKYPARMQRPVSAWGMIGAGICAYDYMDGLPNKYGVKTVVLEVDGAEVFRSVVDRFAYEEHRYINSWTYGKYMKSFIDPGNRLRMLRAAGNTRGWVCIDEERPYHFVYTLCDALGNASKVRFTVIGKKMEIPVSEQVGKYRLSWNETNYLHEPGLELVIPRGMLYDDIALNYTVRSDSGDVAFTYQLHDTRVPLHDYCTLRIGLRRASQVDVSKYYVAGIDAQGRKYPVGGTYEDGFMLARIRELGTYTVAVDTVPPQLFPIGQNAWGRTGRIVFKAKDNATGIASYRGTIDGQYALFGKPNAVNGQLVCVLDPRRVKRGTRHVVEMTVADGCGNETSMKYHFTW